MNSPLIISAEPINTIIQMTFTGPPPREYRFPLYRSVEYRSCSHTLADTPYSISYYLIDQIADNVYLYKFGGLNT